MKIIKHLKFESENKVREIRVLEDDEKRRYVNVIFDYDYSAPWTVSILEYKGICKALVANGFKLTFIMINCE